MVPLGQPQLGMPDLALEHAAKRGVLLGRHQLLERPLHLGFVGARVLVQLLACKSTHLAHYTVDTTALAAQPVMGALYP